eukprot:UC4_evm5s1566
MKKETSPDFNPPHYAPTDWDSAEDGEEEKIVLKNLEREDLRPLLSQIFEGGKGFVESRPLESIIWENKKLTSKQSCIFLLLSQIESAETGGMMPDIYIEDVVLRNSYVFGGFFENISFIGAKAPSCFVAVDEFAHLNTDTSVRCKILTNEATKMGDVVNWKLMMIDLGSTDDCKRWRQSSKQSFLNPGIFNRILADQNDPILFAARWKVIVAEEAVLEMRRTLNKMDTNATNDKELRKVLGQVQEKFDTRRRAFFRLEDEINKEEGEGTKKEQKGGGTDEEAFDIDKLFDADLISQIKRLEEYGKFENMKKELEYGKENFRKKKIEPHIDVDNHKWCVHMLRAKIKMIETGVNAQVALDADEGDNKNSFFKSCAQPLMVPVKILLGQFKDLTKKQKDILFYAIFFFKDVWVGLSKENVMEQKHLIERVWELFKQASSMTVSKETVHEYYNIFENLFNIEEQILYYNETTNSSMRGNYVLIAALEILLHPHQRDLENEDNNESAKGYFPELGPWSSPSLAFQHIGPFMDALQNGLSGGSVSSVQSMGKMTWHPCYPSVIERLRSEVLYLDKLLAVHTRVESAFGDLLLSALIGLFSLIASIILLYLEPILEEYR